MTPCENCGAHHFGLTCSGYPLMLLDDDEPTERDCPLCTEPMNESDWVCTTCRREAAALVPVVMCALDELMWRRRLNAPVRTVRAATAVESAVDDAFDALDWAASAYSAVAKVGALALLGVSLGSLAPLAAMLGGA